MKNLFILYPGGCGGNHLANLISTDSKFTQRFPSDNYYEELLGKYQSKYKTKYLGPYKNHLISIGQKEVKGLIFHFSEFNNLDQLQDPAQVELLLTNKTINIFNGHEHCYYNVETKFKTVGKMPDPLWIMISYPKENTIPYNRIKLYNFSPDANKYKFPFYPTSFIPRDPFDGIIVVDERNGIILESEEIFTEYGSEYIRQTLKPYGVDLPIFADTLHKLWYDKIKEILVLYEVFPNKY